LSSVGSHGAPETPVKVFSSAYRLKSLELTYEAVRWIWPYICDDIPWTQLSHLRVDVDDLHTFKHIIHNCTHLVNLSISTENVDDTDDWDIGGDIIGEGQRGPRLLLSRLEDLVIVSTEAIVRIMLSSLTAPSLKALRIRCEDNMLSIADGVYQQFFLRSGSQLQRLAVTDGSKKLHEIRLPVVSNSLRLTMQDCLYDFNVDESVWLPKPGKHDIGTATTPRPQPLIEPSEAWMKMFCVVGHLAHLFDIAELLLYAQT
jgi:hypothetical protein